MPRKDNILNLPGFSIKKLTNYSPMYIDVSYRRKSGCVYCGCKRLRKKSKFTREVKHELIGHRPTILRFVSYKFRCYHCKKYFNQQFPGIGKYQRSTERLKAQVFNQHTNGMDQKAISKLFKIGKATIERWYHEYYLRENQEIKDRHCPSVLGIDEHSFSRKQGYATTFCDLRKNKIFDVVKGRSAKDLAEFLNQLKGRERVKIVCIDLSSTYRHLVQQYFPNAKIVADRFHVIRLIHHMCMQTYQSIEPSIKSKRGLLAALRTNPDNLSAERLKKRDEFLVQKPAIAAIYSFKRKLHRLLMKKTLMARQCRKVIPLYLKSMRLVNHIFSI
jgi:transposase